ncbi:hypothetical protein B296_00027209 [Ensete ventricosum]|uniref:Uncharacterized protein n=1 Tax=Ensete ventricosum TaxID=4639 RepID=A0A426Y776_ENSVE|nr:hypothetical protein B296_00027209 [Ensete ventricosum]
MGKSSDGRRRHNWQRKRRTMVGSSRQITEDSWSPRASGSQGNASLEDSAGSAMTWRGRWWIRVIADREEGSPLLRLEGSVGSMVRRKCSATNVRRGAGSWEIGVASSQWYGGRRKKVASEGSLSLDRWRGQSLRDALEAKVRGPIYGKGAQCEGWKQSQQGGGRGRVQCDQSWRWSGQSHMVKEEDRTEREGWGRSVRRRNRALKCRALFVDFGTSSTFSEVEEIDEKLSLDSKGRGGILS